MSKRDFISILDILLLHSIFNIGHWIFTRGMMNVEYPIPNVEVFTWKLEIPLFLCSSVLPVSQRVSAAGEDVVFDIDPKSEDHVDDYGRAHGEEGNVDEPHPDP